MKLRTSLFAAGILVVIGLSFALTRPLPIAQDIARYSGAITGRVLDNEGESVSGAEVYAYCPTSPMGKLPRAFTDTQGNFRFTDLASGMYTVSAAKEEDGYPHIDNLFYAAGFVEPPQVSVYEQQTTSDVVVQLGPKAAKLIGRVMDFATGKPLKNAGVEITLSRVDYPNYSYSTDPDVEGDFEILVPPVSFTIEVSTPGYEKWQYRNKGSNQPLDALQLAQGETKRMIIALRPVK